ncbi:hypothetical protein [Nonomuraea sp. NPDC002799]
MSGRHAGKGPTDRPYNSREDGEQSGSTNDQSPESLGGEHTKDEDKDK